MTIGVDLCAYQTVNKVKNVFTSGSSKVTGAFAKARGRGGNDLQRLSDAAEAERQVEARPPRMDPGFDRVHIVIHGACVFFTFLAICITGAVAAFQAKWVGVSGGTGFVLFLILLSFVLSCTLMVIPIAYDRWDKCRRPAQFLSQARAALILNIFGTMLMFTAAVIASAAGFGSKGCKNPDNDPHAEDGGDDFKKALPGWCRTRQASAIFEWFAVACWVALAALAGLAFRKERQTARRREPGFIPPSDEDDAAWGAGPDEDIFGDKHEAQDQTEERRDRIVEPQPRPLSNNYSRVQTADTAMGRPSVDAYGAFDGDMPGSDGRQQPSRTMQMAYSDPYAQIRQSVLNDTPYGQHSPSPAPYNQPPRYTGY